jgi:segregation and condensation protein B
MEDRKQIESLLFSSGRMMSEKELSELTEISVKKVKKCLEELQKDYDERDTSLMLQNAGSSWKLNVKEKYVSLVTKIVADTELPFPVLETLAVIAYSAPALQSEVIKTRGTNAYEHISVLIEGGFIEKKKEGRSFKVYLTNKFFEYFDVPGEKDLKEFLKTVKKPEEKPKADKKLGEFDVVDVPEKQETEESEEKKDEHKLGDLEVFDEPEEKGSSAEDVLPDKDFLDDIDKKISALSQKNDENDEDELLKRKTSEDDSEADDISKEQTEDNENSEEQFEKSSKGALDSSTQNL